MGEVVTFISSQPYLFVPYSCLYDRVTVSEWRSGVQFKDCRYSTSNEKEVAALREFITRYERGLNAPANKRVSVEPSVWEEGNEPQPSPPLEEEPINEDKEAEIRRKMADLLKL